MESSELDLIALTYLGMHGISEESLEKALTLYKKQVPLKQRLVTSKKERGRPTHYGIKFLVFYLYSKHLIETESLPTNIQLVEIAEKVRMIVYEKDTLKKEEIPDELRNPVKLSAVKTWRAEFEKIRSKDPAGWLEFHNSISKLGQKMK